MFICLVMELASSSAEYSGRFSRKEHGRGGKVFDPVILSLNVLSFIDGCLRNCLAANFKISFQSFLK